LIIITCKLTLSGQTTFKYGFTPANVNTIS
jgi:hypothetical protein